MISDVVFNFFPLIQLKKRKSSISLKLSLLIVDEPELVEVDQRAAEAKKRSRISRIISVNECNYSRELAPFNC